MVLESGVRPAVVTSSQNLPNERAICMDYKVPLLLTPQPEGGYTVTSPLLPELVTEGDSLSEALDNVKDALAAVIEIYQDLGRRLPQIGLRSEEI